MSLQMRCTPSGRAGDRVNDARIHLARVGLAGDGVCLLEAETLGHHPVQPLAALMVAIEQGKERRLRTGRPLDAAEAQA